MSPSDTIRHPVRISAKDLTVGDLIRFENPVQDFNVEGVSVTPRGVVCVQGGGFRVSFAPDRALWVERA